MAANLCGPECKAITCSDSKESISSSGLSSRMKTYMYVEGREGWRGERGMEREARGGDGREGWRGEGGMERGGRDREEREGWRGEGRMEGGKGTMEG